MNLWAYNSLRSGLMYMDEHVVDLKQQSMNLLLVHSNASKLTTEACRYKNPRIFLLCYYYIDIKVQVFKFYFESV